MSQNSNVLLWNQNNKLNAVQWEVFLWKQLPAESENDDVRAMTGDKNRKIELIVSMKLFKAEGMNETCF